MAKIVKLSTSAPEQESGIYITYITAIVILLILIDLDQIYFHVYKKKI